MQLLNVNHVGELFDPQDATTWNVFLHGDLEPRYVRFVVGNVFWVNCNHWSCAVAVKCTLGAKAERRRWRLKRAAAEHGG
jgi:hypothetical protein